MEARDASRDASRWQLQRYHADSEILIITIPTDVHEQLHLALYKRIDLQITAKGHPGGDGGEGDSTGGPKPEREGHGTWPTLIEAGDSESLPELRRDMRWWFSTSNHDVKIVLLAKFDS